MESRQGVLLIKGNALTCCPQAQQLPHRHFADPLPTPAAMKLTTRWCIAQPSEQRSTFVVSDVDGRIVSEAGLPPTGGVNPTTASKKQRYTLQRRLRPAGFGRLIFYP